jgi:hypothetical protein
MSLWVRRRRSDVLGPRLLYPQADNSRRGTALRLRASAIRSHVRYLPEVHESINCPIGRHMRNERGRGQGGQMRYVPLIAALAAALTPSPCFGDHSDCWGCRGTDSHLPQACRGDAAVGRARRHRRTLPVRLHHGARRHSAQSYLRHIAGAAGISCGLCS